MERQFIYLKNIFLKCQSSSITLVVFVQFEFLAKNKASKVSRLGCLSDDDDSVSIVAPLHFEVSFTPH